MPAEVYGPDAHDEHRRVPNVQVDAPPWDYDPSAWRQRIPICLIATIGVFVSTYLALYQLGLVERAWDPIFGEGTARVLESKESEWMRSWMRIPDAALGTIAYLGDVVFGLAGSQRRWQYRPWLVILFGIDVIPLGVVSAILVFTQATVIGSWCLLCLVSAVVSLALVPLAYDEVWSSLKYLWRVWLLSHDKRVVWQTFCGRPSDIAARAALDISIERREKRGNKARALGAITAEGRS